MIWNTPLYPYPIFDFSILPRTDREKFLHRKPWVQVLKEFKVFLRKDRCAIVSRRPFNASQEWQNKVTESKIAHDLGLNILPFILTNDIEELHR